MGNYCFKRMMKQIVLSKDTCIPSCTQLQFTTYEISTKLIPVDICSQAKGVFGSSYIKTENAILKKFVNFLVKYGYYDILYHKRHASPKENITDLNDLAYSLCVKMIEKDAARVSVMFERKRYVKTTTNVKTTIVDALANVGKNNVQNDFAIKQTKIEICSIFNFLCRWDTWTLYRNKSVELD